MIAGDIQLSTFERHLLVVLEYLRVERRTALSGNASSELNTDRQLFYGDVVCVERRPNPSGKRCQQRKSCLVVGHVEAISLLMCRP